MWRKGPQFNAHPMHYQVTLLTYYVFRPTQPPTSVGWEMSSTLRAMGWRPSVVDWGDGMSASCKPRVRLFVHVGSGWPHSVLRYHQLMPISCHFQDCKALLVLSQFHVRSTIASTGLYLFLVIHRLGWLLYTGQCRKVTLTSSVYSCSMAPMQPCLTRS